MKEGGGEINTFRCLADEMVANLQTYVRRILDSPSIPAFWRIAVKDQEFHRRVGRLFGGIKVMEALGFQTEENGAIIALRDPAGKVWEAVPQGVRVVLNSRLDELLNHKHSLTEPSISNIAAGALVSVSVTVSLSVSCEGSLTISDFIKIDNFCCLFSIISCGAILQVRRFE